MNIEILKDILDLTEDKQNTIVYFLNHKIQQKLTNFYYYDKDDTDIFVNQHIILVKKNDLSLEEKGIITSVKRGVVGLNVHGSYNIYLPIKDYYIFLKNTRSRKSDRDFMESLLKKL